MHDEQKVSDMAIEVLAQQTRIRAERTGEPFEGAVKTMTRMTTRTMASAEKPAAVGFR
jgi:hypothetical protein